MPYEHSLQRYRNVYAQLLRFYPKSHYERFGEGMEQTFNDLLRERAGNKRELFHQTLWIFIETVVGILKEHVTIITMQHLTRRLTVWAVIVALILMIPLVAMQFTSEVQWSPFDFVFMGILMFGAALTYELIARKGGTSAYRGAVAMAGVASFLLIWVNGAVGIIGSEDNPANLLYGGVLLTGFFGAILSQLKPQGMARTAFAMAIVQALVPVTAFLLWRPDFSPGVAQVFFLNTFWVALFVGSGLLFRRAGVTGSR